MLSQMPDLSLFWVGQNAEMVGKCLNADRYFEHCVNDKNMYVYTCMYISVYCIYGVYSYSKCVHCTHAHTV